MLKDELVSIITPCYNGEKHIFRLLDSILAQTYPKIEMFIIDDGSTDRTRNIIKSYISKFEAKGYSLLYIYQENSGQAAAINKGLALYSGEYLVWPDSDDYYSTTTSIEKMVSTLATTPDSVSLVRTNAITVDEESLCQTGKIKNPKQYNNIFEDCIFENNFNLVPGKFLVKAKILKKELLNNNIYENKGGQNWQLLIPILHNYSIVTIHECLYTIVERRNSHSRQGASQREIVLRKIIEHKDILRTTIINLKNIKEEYRTKILTLIDLKYDKRYLSMYYSNDMKDDFMSMFNQLKKKHPKTLTVKDYLKKIILTLKLK